MLAPFLIFFSHQLKSLELNRHDCRFFFCGTSEVFALFGRQAPANHARYLRTMAARKSIQDFPVKVSFVDWLVRGGEM